uniref:Uncharacterized protein n=1 Tax=Meloidogyne javanica TaxID=6303 RepID=A0A915MVD9_MELJA
MTLFFSLCCFSISFTPSMMLFRRLVVSDPLRIILFVLGGLTKLVSDGTDISGFRLMFSSRHVLAIVCGLGMGVMASLFLLTNILADYSDDGVVGLPSEIYGNGIADLSLYYLVMGKFRT